MAGKSMTEVLTGVYKSSVVTWDDNIKDGFPSLINELRSIDMAELTTDQANALAQRCFITLELNHYAWVYGKDNFLNTSQFCSLLHFMAALNMQIMLNFSLNSL